MSGTRPEIGGVAATAAELRRTRGWQLLWAYVLVHNIWAVIRGHEMLSQTAKRQREAHPLLVPVLAGMLLAHLMGWLGRGDPISWVGVAVERRRDVWRASHRRSNA